MRHTLYLPNILQYNWADGWVLTNGASDFSPQAAFVVTISMQNRYVGMLI